MTAGYCCDSCQQKIEKLVYSADARGSAVTVVQHMKYTMVMLTGRVSHLHNYRL